MGEVRAAIFAESAGLGAHIFQLEELVRQALVEGFALGHKHRVRHDPPFLEGRDAIAFGRKDPVHPAHIHGFQHALFIRSIGVEAGIHRHEGFGIHPNLAIAQAHDPDALQHDSKAFQATLNSALAAWREGGPGFTEPYAEFRGRVMTAFTAACEVASRKGRRVLVFTSGGPIAMVVSHLVAGDDSAFQRLNDVVVNSAVSTVLVGSTGPRLLTFNDHGHLPASDVTFR